MADRPGNHCTAASDSASAAPAPARVTTRHHRPRSNPAEKAA